MTRLVHGNDYVTFGELGVRNAEAAEHGDADFFVLQSDVVARYALANHTELLAAIPFKSIRLDVDRDDVHHRSETSSGVGDLRLGAKQYLVSNKSLQLSGSLGLSLPTGRLNEVTAASYLGHDEASALGIVVPVHNHVQLGTGTFYPFLRVEALTRFDSPWMIFGSAQAELPFYENEYGYQTSASGTLTLGPALRVTSLRSVFSVFVEAFYSGRDRFSGDSITGTNGVLAGELWVPNTGRFEVAIRPGATWSASEQWTFNAQARIAMYTEIRTEASGRDVQLSEPFGLLMSFTYTPH